MKMQRFYMSLYSVKMRGSKNIEGNNKHISGAENIVKEEDVERVCSLLVKRALNHQQGKSEEINIKIEKIKKEELIYLDPLKARTIEVKDLNEGLTALKKVLTIIGIDLEKATTLIELLRNIKNMRGAALVDINTLERLDSDKSRGVRVTYMDLENKDLNSLTKSEKYNSHFIEALVLATKVISCEGIKAEICYSDDPNYTAGYVATKEYGYIRFDHLKEIGNPFGGRIFLYDGKKDKLNEAIEYLEKARVIVKDNIIINKSVPYEKFMDLGGESFE